MTGTPAQARALNLLTALVVVFLCFCIARHVTAPAVRPGPGTPQTQSTQLPEVRIDLNRASEAELSLLPGVGPNLAARIVAYRTEHGPFTDLAQLDRVPGVGAKIVQRFAPFSIVSTPHEPRPTGSGTATTP